MVNHTGGVMMAQCPKCRCTECTGIVNKRQLYPCNHCGYRLNYQQRGNHPAIKRQALKVIP